MPLRTLNKAGKVVGPGLSLGATTSVPALIAKIFGLGAALGAGVSLTPLLVAGEQWAMLIGLWAGVCGLVAVYSTKRLIPLKYLAPGTLLLTVFVILPIISTVQLSFTNSGDGTRGSKEDTITTIVQNSVTQLPDSKTYNLTVGTQASATEGPFTFFLVDTVSGDVSAGDAQGLKPLPGVAATDGFVRSVPGYTILTGKEVNAAGPKVTDLTVPTEAGAIRAQGINRAFEGVETLTYDAGTDRITDSATGKVYTVQKFGDREYFADANGVKGFDQSWERNVGFDNYARLFTDPQIRDSLLGSFVWTLVFAVGSVASTFVLGLLLASALNDPRVRGMRLYRAVLIIPYAIPVFISFVVWQSFYNKDFGLINSMLGGAKIDWLGDPFLAKVAVMLTNLWVGFPYMFLIATGALQALPQDIAEAAKIDGANGWTTFTKVQFPLLLVAVAPLLVSSFAFNFNNFNVIQLVTGGGPFPASGGQIGATDILISGAYRIAFGGAGAEFGFASAISVVLFIATAVLAGIQFRYTKALEDVR
jgi:arabinogalactan oligomer/maltooligosaccharide transport system permease protein